jgi:hypothetical protein
LVTLTLGRNGFENAFNLIAFHGTWLRRSKFHALNPEHWVVIKQFVLISPGKEARYSGLLVPLFLTRRGIFA